MTETQPFVAKAILEQLGTEPMPDWFYVASRIRVRCLEPGESLFRVDEHHPYVYFVREGIIKMIYETEDGKEWTKALSEEGRFFASMTALEPSGRTSFSAHALCHSVVEQVPYQVLLARADKHPVWQSVLRRAFEIYGYRKEMRERELLTLSPEARYVQFIESRAALATRLTHKEIAAYIRVTPVGLSRIKKRVQQAGNLQ